LGWSPPKANIKKGETREEKKKKKEDEELSMTTVSPWRAPATCVLVFSSFTKQIDQIARPEAAVAAAKFPRDPVLAAAAATRHSGPRANTRRVY